MNYITELADVFYLIGTRNFNEKLVVAIIYTNSAQPMAYIYVRWVRIRNK